MNTPENSNTASRSAAAGGGVDWQSRYLAGDTPWDKGAPHPALPDFLEKTPLAGRVLVPGCGSGHDARAIAAAGDCEVVGIDIAPAALERAASFPESAAVTYILGDFLSGNAVGAGTFDCLFEHTCFCAIPPSRRRDYALAAASALRPGGLLVGVFFLDPDNPDPHSPPFRAELDEIRGYFQNGFALERVFPNPPTYPERTGREALLVFRRRAVE